LPVCLFCLFVGLVCLSACSLFVVHSSFMSVLPSVRLILSFILHSFISLSFIHYSFCLFIHSFCLFVCLVRPFILFSVRIVPSVCLFSQFVCSVYSVPGILWPMRLWHWCVCAFMRVRVRARACARARAQRMRAAVRVRKRVCVRARAYVRVRRVCVRACVRAYVRAGIPCPKLRRGPAACACATHQLCVLVHTMRAAYACIPPRFRRCHQHVSGLYRLTY
jgi:hypothetical protein